MGRASRIRPKHMHKKLKAIRLQLRVTQESMCQMLGFKMIHPPNISGYESGKREPPYPVLLRYSQIARISTDVLIDDTWRIGKD